MTMALSTPNVMARPSTDHNALHSSQAKALAEALAQQASHLTFISENLPAFLPAAPHSKATAVFDRAVSAEPDKENAQPRGAARPSAQPDNAAAAPAARKAKLTAPCRFINIESCWHASATRNDRIAHALEQVQASHACPHA